MDRKVLFFNIVSLLSVLSIALFYTGDYLPHTRNFRNYHLSNISLHFIRQNSSTTTLMGNAEETSNKTVETRCNRQDNFVFAKVHKCGSSTVQAIFFHYAYNHKLIVALPKRVRRAWIGTPYNIPNTSYLPTPGGKQWNIFNHHNVYDKAMFLRLMPADTKFVTILREPLSRISSAFNYFHLHKYFTGMSDSVTERKIPPIKIFLSDPWYWEERFHPPPRSGAGSIHDFGCVRNCMAKDLGLAEKSRADQDAVKRYIEKLDEDFTTVMLLEKLDESLVLLKRRMCWSLKDIIYRKGTRLKRRPYKFKGENVQLKGSNMNKNFTQEMQENFKKYSATDFEIYNHFHVKLLKELAKEGQDFLQEVAEFKHILDEVGHYCRTRNKPSKLWLKESKWNAQFSINVQFCLLLRKQRPGWASLLRRHYYDNVRN